MVANQFVSDASLSKLSADQCLSLAYADKTGSQTGFPVWVSLRASAGGTQRTSTEDFAGKRVLEGLCGPSFLKMEMETTMALKTMPIAKLQDLKSKVDAAINEKVGQRRRELEAELSKLARFGGGGKALKFGRGGPKGSVAPKYRNPDNPEETWAGRGLKPRWLTAAIKSGAKLEDFAISAPKVSTSGARPNKGRKSRKAQK